MSHPAHPAPDPVLALEPPHLEIPTGTELLVEIEGVYGQFKSLLVGGREERYLIIRTPLAPPGIATKLFKGNKVIVRYAEDGVMCGFQSNILCSINDPEPLLFLSTPVLLEEKSMRAVRRIDVHLPCLAAVRNQAVEGTITDLALSGCRCILPTHLPSGILHLHMGDVILLEAQLAGEKVRFQGKLTNVRMLQSTAHVGVHFDALDEGARASLVHFLAARGVETQD